MGVMRRAIAGSLLVLSLTACGQAAGTDAASPVSSGSPASQVAPAATPAAVTSGDACPAQEPSHLPQALEAVTEAYICLGEDRAVPGEGVALVQVVRRVTGGLDALLTAYAAPDEAPTPDTICGLAAWNPLVVYLHDDSGVHAVRAPTTSCSAPTEPASSAYTALVTAVVGEGDSRTLQSQLSVDSNCPDDYKDTLSIDEQLDNTSPSDLGTAASTPTPLTSPVSVCTYRFTSDEQGMRAGRLDGHDTLTGDQLSAVNEALSLARPDPSCSRQEHTRFAVLNGGQRDSTVVALDGCAVSQDEGWWGAADQLRLSLGA